MSHYSRASYQRRRQEEQMMFQRIAAEEQQIQNFLLLQQDDLTSEFIGGPGGTASEPTPDIVTTRWYAYTGSTGVVNFTQSTVAYAKNEWLYSVANNFSGSGEGVRSFVPFAVGVQLYTFNPITLYTTPGNYIGPSLDTVITVNSSGIITAITDFADIP